MKVFWIIFIIVGVLLSINKLEVNWVKNEPNKKGVLNENK